MEIELHSTEHENLKSKQELAQRFKTPLCCTFIILALVCTGLNPLKLPALYLAGGLEEGGRARGLRASAAAARHLRCKLLNVCAPRSQSCSVMQHKLHTQCASARAHDVRRVQRCGVLSASPSRPQQPFPGVAGADCGQETPGNSGIAGSVLFPRKPPLPSVSEGSNFK